MLVVGWRRVWVHTRTRFVSFPFPFRILTSRLNSPYEHVTPRIVLHVHSSHIHTAYRTCICMAWHGSGHMIVSYSRSMILSLRNVICSPGRGCNCITWQCSQPAGHLFIKASHAVAYSLTGNAADLPAVNPAAVTSAFDRMICFIG